MRVAVLTEGGYPYARGESVVWCDRLLRGLGGHEFEVYALSRSHQQEAAGWRPLPGNVRQVRTAPLWGDPPPGGTPAAPGRPGARAGAGHGRRERRRFADAFGQLAEAVCGAGPDEDGALADRFAEGLYGLADLARERGGLPAALRSERAARILQAACRAPGTLRAAHTARVADLLAVTERLERALRPLSLDWYGDGGGDGDGRPAAGAAPGPAGSGGRPGLRAADLCHAVGAGPAALPGLLARRAFGTPLLITEYGVRLREHYLTSAADAVAPAAAGAPVRALLASFQWRLAHEAYAAAQLVTPGNAHARRWQERCGARPERLRTVYPGMDAACFAEVGERAADPRAEAAGAPTVAWVGRIEPAKDLPGLLHAFAEVRRAVPGARLRLIATAPGRGPDAADHEARCRALAERLFPPVGTRGGGRPEPPAVTFERLGGATVPTPAHAYAAGRVVVLASTVEGFPVSLVEAMFCGRATVSTDVGAVREVIGGTGLVVPARDPRALADGCVALLHDPERCARLGAAARARALELFTVEQNVAAFRGIYLELMSRSGSRAGGPLPFARPAEAHVPGRWAAVARARRPVAAGAAPAPPGRCGPRPRVPSWARDLPDTTPLSVVLRPRAHRPSAAGGSGAPGGEGR